MILSNTVYFFLNFWNWKSKVKAPAGLSGSKLQETTPCRPHLLLFQLSLISAWQRRHSPPHYHVTPFHGCVRAPFSCQRDGHHPYRNLIWTCIVVNLLSHPRPYFYLCLYSEVLDDLGLIQPQSHVRGWAGVHENSGLWVSHPAASKWKKPNEQLWNIFKVI